MGGKYQEYAWQIGADEISHSIPRHMKIYVTERAAHWCDAVFNSLCCHIEGAVAGTLVKGDVDIKFRPKDKVLDFVILAFHFNWAGERIMGIA